MLNFIFQRLVILLFFTAAVPAAAEIQCRLDRTYSVAKKDGTIVVGHLCWKGQEEIPSVKLSRGTAVKVNEPFVQVGDERFHFRNTFIQEICKELGFLYGEVGEGFEKMFSFHVARIMYSSPERPKTADFELIKAKQNNFLKTLYCSSRRLADAAGDSRD